MRAVLCLAALEFRARWRDWMVLALLIGLAGGAVLASAAGARRTDSAYARFLQASRASGVRRTSCEPSERSSAHRVGASTPGRRGAGFPGRGCSCTVVTLPLQALYWCGPGGGHEITTVSG